VGTGTVHIKHKITLSRESKILQFYQIEKTQQWVTDRGRGVRKFNHTKKWEMSKKNLNTLPFPLGCIQIRFLSAVSQTHLILVVILSFFKQTGSLMTSVESSLYFLLPDSLIELNVSEYCEYLLIFCTSLQSVMVLAYTVEPLLKTCLREELFIP